MLSTCRQLQDAPTAASGSELRQHAAMHVFLETERLTLRRFTADDVGHPRRARQRSRGHALHHRRATTSREEIETTILPAFLDYYERYVGYGFWAVIERSTGAFIGWFHFRPEHGDDPGRGRARLPAAPLCLGQGLRDRRVAGLIDKGFIELGVRRVHATTMVVNTASRASWRRPGLRYVRTFHQPWPYPIPGDEHGDVEYALSAAEWQGG